jgi:hypothetical protein
MYQHVWYQKLKYLNPRLRVCQFESSSHFPGIYYVDDHEGIVDICATDIGWVPPYPEFDRNGSILKVGFRRIIFILLHLHLTTPDKVRSLWPGFFEQRLPALKGARAESVHQQWSEMMKHERTRFNILGSAKQVDTQDRITDKMKQMEIDNFNRKNSAALSGDQFVELADDIKRDMPDYKKENLDRAKFEYDKATSKRKTLI